MRYKFKIKYGNIGLFLRFRYGKNFNKKKDIILSKDYKKIFHFLNLDYSKWEEGFDDLEEIFTFVSKSNHFNPNSFQLKNLNSNTKHRNLKRKSYISFLEWIDVNFETNNLIEKQKNISLNEINELFPEANLKLILSELNYDYSKEVLIKQKFNGKELIKRFGLEGKVLGLAINDFKTMIELEGLDFNNYILNEDSDNIYGEFEHWFNKY